MVCGLQECVLFFNLVGPRNGTQVPVFATSSYTPLNHLTGYMIAGVR